MLAVETFGLTKQFRTSLAVDNIDLQVPVGAICGFLGRNGAGKTTTIKMLTGLKRPTSGEFAIMGERGEFGHGIRRVGYLPDVPGFYGYMTGHEFLMLCAKLCEVPENQQSAHVDELLKKVDLHGVDTKISGYSRGMRQRLGIAQALVDNPPVVFMDEPISALDPMGRREVMDIIGNLKGTTIVFSTHILSDVENICDYIIIIEKGQIRVQKNIDELKRLWAKDMAKVRFYDEDAGEKFSAAVIEKFDSMNVETDPKDPLQVLVRCKTSAPAGISQMVAATLSDFQIPFASFNFHAPTLDEIFYEVTRDE
ncbi:MAG: ABC transporter ATP-binding protein [Defluviitaleaceae bacterium]|nr:ABC transporter ATP-binding protein [Defluviitaleaceae bacterium]